MTKDMNLTQLLEDWIGPDDEAVRGSTQRPDNPKYWTKKTAHRNELKAELRTQIPTLLAKIEQHVLEARKDGAKVIGYRLDDRIDITDPTIHREVVESYLVQLDALLNTKETE